MFLRLTIKELVQQLRSITFYLFLGIVLLFYFTQFSPPGADRPLEPLDETHFLYWKLLGDYQDGKIINDSELKRLEFIKMTRPLTDEEKRQEAAADITLSPVQKEAVKRVIEKMNPGGTEKRENVANIRFQIGKEELDSLLEELHTSLGGMTYYGSSFRETLLSHENYYGGTDIKDPKDKMRILYGMMKQHLEEGKVLSYTLGFGKSIHLSEEQKGFIRKAMAEVLPSGSIEDPELKFSVSFKRFVDIMRDIDSRLGGGTYYGDSMRESFMHRSRTYEEARADFDVLLTKDRITRAFGRLFADYSGITAGFFPVFLAAFILTRDRRNKMHELIYSRSVSSFVYVSSKFAAVVFAVLLCYLVIATHATYVFAEIAGLYGYTIDYLAFYTHTFVWILPTVLFTAALSLLVSVAFGNGIMAIPVQLLLWFSSLMPLSGDYSLLKPILRFNDLGGYEKYRVWLDDILLNRAFYAGLSLLLLVLAAKVLSWRRVSGYGQHFARSQNHRV